MVETYITNGENN